MRTTSSSPGPQRALILTFRAQDYQAVGAALTDVHEARTPDGTIYEVGQWRDESTHWEVLLVEVGIDQGGAVAEMVRLPGLDLIVTLGEAESRGRLPAGTIMVANKVMIVISTPRPGSPTKHRDITLKHSIDQVIRAEVRRMARERDLFHEDPWGSELGESERRPWVPDVVVGSLLAIETGGVPLNLADSDALVRGESSSLLALVGLVTPVVVVRAIMPSEIDELNTLRHSWHLSAVTFAILKRLGDPGRVARLPEVRSATSEQSDAPAQNYLHKVEVHRLRSLREVAWEIPAEPGWIVILGDNGSGKTTFLRSLALTLLDREEVDKLPIDWFAWMPEGVIEAGASVQLQQPGGGAETELQRSFELVRSKGAVRHEFSQSALSPNRPFSASYGPFRRFSGGDSEFQKKMSLYPRLMRHLSLFSERAALTESLAWLKDLRFKELEKKPEGATLDRVKRFINTSCLLPQGTTLEEISSDQVLFLDGNGSKVPVEELSDGYRSVLSLALDLLRHMLIAFNPETLFDEDGTKVIARGIVLIDEVDAHLHPSWQHQIGDWFKEHFPLVQFIVTTHSPIICQAADSVFLLPRPGTEDSARMLEGIELERVRNGNVLDAYGTGVFGENVTRSNHSQEMMARLAELNIKEFDQELNSRERDEQEALRAILATGGSAGPAVETEHQA